jgi:ATP-binding cassette, subfamily F, member 3
MQRDIEFEEESGKNMDKDTDAISKRLQEIYKRLDFIGADAAEARAASILAVRAFLLIDFHCTTCICMQDTFFFC